jgi:hypothetical protein
MGRRHIFSSGGVGGVPPPYPPPRKNLRKKKGGLAAPWFFLDYLPIVIHALQEEIVPFDTLCFRIISCSLSLFFKAA